MTESKKPSKSAVTRRGFVSATTASLAVLGLGCGGGGSGSGADASGSQGTAGSGGPGGTGGGGDVPPAPLGWTMIPDLTFMVGVPVELDFRGFLSGGVMVSIDLDRPLPDGLTWEDGFIRGTPTTVTAPSDYVATADDGIDVVVSEPFAIQVDPASQLVMFEFERGTPEQIAMNLGIVAPLAPETTATVRYREAGAADWVDAHPLLRITPAWVTGGAPQEPVDALAGTIFDLRPGTSYQVEVTIDVPGQAGEILSSAVTTRALPAAAGAATMTVSPGGDLQGAFDSMTPGTVLELADGAYDVQDLAIAVEGTVDGPIVVRGASRDGVILRATGRILQLVETSHLVIENLTLEGSGVDSGTDASARGIEFWNGFVQENITIRNVTIAGVDEGITAAGTTYGTLIYECILRGNNVWTAAFIETNLTWNDDGVRMPGEGNCVFQNTFTGFGDTCAVQDGVHSAAVYFYRNRITMTGDDACEGDYSTRNFAFYDNHVTNCATALSLDPVWGGPLYFFRNIVVNTTRGPFKFNNTNSGFMVYNNTIIRTNGLSDWGWAQANNGSLRGYSFRNNLILFYGGTGNLLALESGDNDPIDFTHNGWFDDGSVWWTSSGGSYGSLGEARQSLGPTTPMFGSSAQRHEADVLLGPAPFSDAIPLGPDHLTEVQSLYVPTLQGGSVAAGAGVPIPNVTDGFSGAAPDMGAVITGRPLPQWGAS